MKKKLLYPLMIISLVFVILSSAVAVTSGKGLVSDPDISRQQMEAQISLFHSVLLEFGASSPEEALRLWTEGNRMRNGVYQYAVSCSALKQRIIDEWGVPEKSFWIIGGSSPWMTQYDILSKTEVSPTEIAYVVQYQWATSAGQEAPTTERLLLQKIGDVWCVSSAEVPI